jgi:hypothetical protein
MTYRGNLAHEAADKIAELTGWPRFIRWLTANYRQPHAKRQIVVPVVAIAGQVAVFIATLSGMRVFGGLGPLIFYLAFWASFFGPIRMRDSAMPYDERELVLIWRSRSIGLATALALALIGFAVRGFSDAFSILEHIDVKVDLLERIIIELQALLLVATTGMCVTTIIASVMLPKDTVDDDAD